MFNPKFCMDCGSGLILKKVDRGYRLACSSNCGYIFWNNPVPAIAVLIKYQDKYLIAHNKIWPKGLYSTISGYLKEKETTYECTSRITREELGLHVIKSKIIDTFTDTEMNQLIIAVLAECDGEILLNRETDGTKLLTADQLKQFDVGSLKLLADIIDSCENLKLFNKYNFFKKYHLNFLEPIYKKLTSL
ncbi:NUDIX domain-containing protein [Acinetobacter nosocomialis]|jgi:NADH pyrophosphatase NudC (nudix superfamily)|uniref:NUDIX domain-containing protein n=1 Tax=Acinetobacter TaxID=469 RepID=UPI000B3CFBF8|nr:MULTISPECIES: NUDIX domain-containing protein [Acinetobacter]AZM39031.1 NUDIX hydrolase [Acinetobacter baumannii]QCA01462.1 NUDIX hydrolase [Acinetobacter nosocomialis]